MLFVTRREDRRGGPRNSKMSDDFLAGLWQQETHLPIAQFLMGCTLGSVERSFDNTYHYYLTISMLM